jgi:hypothetical protein
MNLDFVDEHSIVGGGDHVHAAAASVELHLSVDQGKQGEILAQANAATGVERGANLAHQDAPRTDVLAAEPFYAASLSVGVATVAAGTLTFFVCHRRFLKSPRVGMR